MDKDPTSGGARAEADGASTLDLSGRCVGSSYILIRPIGQGATGTVWRGVDRASGEPVAVKLLHESLLRQPKLVTRFVQERTILLMLRHRNVVRVRDLFSVGESLGLVMDLVAGGSLREYLREHHTLPAGEAARLAAQVAAALAEAHELGVIHRDLKPDNILLSLDGDRLDTRLTDFGIARVLNTPSLTTPNAVVGTPHYMSPEAFHGAAATPAADVYALGVLLYEMVSGRPPYDSDNVADLMRRHLEGNAERRPGIPDALWEVIESCMAGKPRLRPTAADLVGELTAVARSAAEAPALPAPRPRDAGSRDTGSRGAAARMPSRSGGGHPSSIVPAPRRFRRRNEAPSWRWGRPGPAVALVAGAMLASGVATTAWHLGRAGDDPGRARAAANAAPRAAGAAASVEPAPDPAVRPSGAKPAAHDPAHAGAIARPAAPAPATLGGATPVAAASAPRSRAPLPEAKPYGPWQCRQSFQVTLGGDPLLVGACHTLGSQVQIKTTLAAPPGGSGTLAVWLRDASSGRTAAGPRTCPSLAYADRQVARDCGPVTVSVPHGRSYVVAMSWTYTKGTMVAKGTATGAPFAW